VFDASSKTPVIAAVIRLSRASIWSADSYEATTAMDGRFAFNGVPSGKYRMTVEGTGYTLYSSRMRIEDSDSLHTTVHLHKSGANRCDTCVAPPLVIGKTTDIKSNAPIPDVNITLPGELRQMITATDGMFSIADIRAGTWRLAASHQDYLPDTIEVTASAGRAVSVEFFLQSRLTSPERTGILTGVVTDSSGQGVAQASVSMLNTDYSVLSDIDGRYELAAIVPGAYSVMVSKWGYDAEVVSGITIRAKETSMRNFSLTSREAGMLSADAPGAISGVVTSPEGDLVENAMEIGRASCRERV